MSVKEETIEVLFEDFLEFKLAYWHGLGLEWANVTFVQWITDLIYEDEIIKLSTQEEYQ